MSTPSALRRGSAGGLLGLLVVALLSTNAGLAQDLYDVRDDEILAIDEPGYWPAYTIPGKPEISTLYADGSQIVIDTFQRWELIIGSNPGGVTALDLAAWAGNHEIAMAEGPITVVDSGVRSGLNIVYNLDASVPSGAVPSFGLAEAYLESQFSDVLTVSIDVSFQPMGSGVIGGTAPYYVQNIGYATCRAGLVSDMDLDDTIQSWLPTTDYCPVRYNGSSSTVTNEYYVDWARANYRAAVGSASTLAASMSFNTQFSFDYDPSDGVPGNKMSLVDIIIHETGHALGFISGADGFGGTNFCSLDLYRFQRTDGGSDYNPDTLAEFQTYSRLVDYNNPNDDHNSDIISNEWRMSDGSPYQASHFREQSPAIGIMDPAFTYGFTFYPDYFSNADKKMFDAIGWDYPPCTAPIIQQQPVGVTVTAPDPVNLSIVVTGCPPFYQWYKDWYPLSNDDRISGATGPDLTISPSEAGDTGEYFCRVINDQGEVWSDFVDVVVNPGVCAGDASCDDQVDFGDINPFVAAMLCVSDPDPEACWEAQYPGCPYLNADANEDESVDFGDINVFVDMLTTQSLPILCQ